MGSEGRACDLPNPYTPCDPRAMTYNGDASGASSIVKSNYGLIPNGAHKIDHFGEDYIKKCLIVNKFRVLLVKGFWAYSPEEGNFLVVGTRREKGICSQTKSRGDKSK